MGKCGVKYKEMRFVIKDELTHAFVLIDAIGDCPLGLQGWHHKAFRASIAVIDIMQAWIDGDNPEIWAQMSPEELKDAC